MIWHLLAVFISGLVLGAFAFLLRKLSRNLIPSWIIPVAAGFGMLGYLAYYNYTWYDFRVGQLPAESVVLKEERNSNFFQPWSYIAPAVNYFEFIDGEFKAYDQDGEQLIQYIRYEFFQDYVDRLKNKTFLLNCAKAEQFQLGEDGSLVPPYRAHKVDRSSALYKKLCK